MPADVDQPDVAAPAAEAKRRPSARTPSTPLPRKPKAARPVKAPAVGATSARTARRYRVRKVHRTVRHIEPWSVLKISLIFYFCIWLIMLVAGAVLWRVAVSSGLIDNVEKFIKEIFALESFTFEAAQIFRAYALGGLVMVVALTGFTVLLAILFNLISDLTGGIRVTVLEDETARPVGPPAATGPVTAVDAPPALETGTQR